ncbi:Glycosyl transferase [Parasponia andersonii]|uniref:Hexosyltransferase n=1 Tax=Parasponia andersonii TaxID=3476 RepID=A0A2P5B690_PARAD|nr:Glycosyl transferase [Parasponia andersonii]
MVEINIRSSQTRLSGSTPRSRISPLLLAFYDAGRLWQDAEVRAYLIQELDQRTAQGQSVISVDDTLQTITCSETGRLYSTTFGHRKNRDAIRKAWMPTGSALKKLANEEGIIVKFFIGRSSNRGDSLDVEIDRENRQTHDFLVLDDQVESPEEHPRKIKSFLVHALDKWDAELFVKVNDDVFVNIDSLGAILTAHLDKHHIYIGRMKSGQVVSEPTNKWYKPDWWKFGDAKSYFRPASGDIYAISRSLAQYVSINRPILRTHAYDDVRAGSWFIGLDVEHIDEQMLCSLSQSTGCLQIKERNITLGERDYLLS